MALLELIEHFRRRAIFSVIVVDRLSALAVVEHGGRRRVIR